MEKNNNFCSECGEKLESGQSFCPNCGKKINKANDLREQGGSSINDETNNKVTNESKKIKSGKIAAIIVIVFVIIIGIYLYHQIKSEMTKEEQIAFLRLHSTGYRGGELSQNHLDVLKNMAKRVKNNSEWFGSSYGFTAKNADTDKYDITYLCNDSYCAKFTVSGIRLVGYEFSPKAENGYSVYIVKEYSK